MARDGKITIKVDANEALEALGQVKNGIDMLARRLAPDFVIDALTMWHERLADDLPLEPELAELADKVHYWLHGDEADEQESYVFTFGPGHMDPDDNSLGDCYVEILGDYEVARARMIEVFGNQWSMQYSSTAQATGNGKYVLTDRHDLVPEKYRP